MDEEAARTVERMPSERPNNSNETLVEKSQSEFTTRSSLAIAGSAGAAFCTVGFFNAFGVFETYYAETILSNETDSNIGWIAAINVFLLFGGSFITGRILDLFGPRIMFWVGSAIMVFAIMMISLCQNFWQLILAQGVLLGLGETLLLCPAIALASQHFKKQAAFAIGIVIGGSSVGGIVWPVIVHSLINIPSIGFAWTMRISGFIMLPILAVSCVIARPPLDSQNSKKTTQAPSAQKSSDWSWVAQPKMLLTAAAFFFVYFGMFMPFFYTTDYSLSKGLSENLSFYTICLVNGASLFGRILPGIVADKYGRFNLCLFMTGFSGIISLCWTSVSSVAGIVFFSLAYGFTSGGILSLQQACVAQIATPSTRGAAVGFVMTSTALSAMASTPIGGALIEQYGYLSLSIYSGVSLLLGTVVLAMARLVQNRKMLAAV